MIFAPFLLAVMAGELEGPARFCGFSPIIDLEKGERIVTLDGGVHGGSFRWEGPFGSLLVYGLGWAAKPPGDALKRTARGHRRFPERQDKRGYTVALWNGQQGAAYFSSQKPLTKAQRAAIDRVDLYNEGEEPEGCALRTVFSWE